MGLAVIGGIIGSTGEDTSGPDKLTAYVMAEGWVEDRLKAPSTAKFPNNYDEHTTKISENKFRINSYLDAENSFGAMIRTRFTAVVEYVGDDKWRLISIDIE